MYMIFGVTGQDGSTLADMLLEHGEEVVGVKRRCSTDNTQNLVDALKKPKFNLIEGDLTDAASVSHIIGQYKPEYIINVAAQSHVYTSFDQPSYTFQVNAVGVLNLLEGIRILSPKTKFISASSSEMYGSNHGSLHVNGNSKLYQQNEETSLLPNSPYGVSKVAAHYLCRVYRQSYGIFAATSLAFNHETLSYSMPLIIKHNGKIDILPIGDIARFHTGVNFDLNKMKYQCGEPTQDIEVWDKDGWTKVKYVSGYPHQQDKNPRIINARNFAYTATADHICFMEDGEKKTKEIQIGDLVKEIGYPDFTANEDKITLEEAEFLGMLCGDGHHCNGRYYLTNKDMELKQRFVDLWMSFNSSGSYSFSNTTSGFNGDDVGRVCCSGGSCHDDIYTDDISVFGHSNKKVPRIILNSPPDIMEAFLNGYNLCDGLKANKCTYKYKCFTTNSATLASGLLFLISKVTGQKWNICIEESWKYGKQQFYYHLNLLSDKETNIEKYQKIQRILSDKPNLPIKAIKQVTGYDYSFIDRVKQGYNPSKTHWKRGVNNEVKKIIEIPNYNGWFFDLETESGSFHAGVGNGYVHNSPRRGHNFVTRKVSLYVAEVAYAKKHNTRLFNKLKLGNLNACRDWGHAKDVCDAILRIVRADEPDDYVVATGEVHSVRELCEIAFSYIGEKWEDYVCVDKDLMRPLDVEYLCGDYSKIKNKLGWEPQTTFTDLIIEMVKHDIDEKEKAYRS